MTSLVFKKVSRSALALALACGITVAGSSVAIAANTTSSDTSTLSSNQDTSKIEGKLGIWLAGYDSVEEGYASLYGGEAASVSAGSEVSTLSSLQPMDFSEEMLYFCKYESNCNYDQGLSSGDGYHAMGYFQFDNRYGLGDFLKAVYEYDSSTFACLATIGDTYDWNTYGDSNGDMDAQMQSDLNTAWHAAYAAAPTLFSQLQNGWAYEEYYNSDTGVRLSLQALGIEIDDRADCVKGLVWGMTNLFGQGGGASYINQGLFYGANWFYYNSGINNAMSDEEFVTTLCNYVVDHVAERYPSQTQYHEGWQNRYRNELQDCLSYLQSFGASNVTYPTALRHGSSFTFSGTIRSNEIITSVVGEIVDTNGNVVMAASASPNAYNFSIENSTIDNSLTMASLSDGSYRYVLTASTASESKTFVDERFDVYTPVTLSTNLQLQVAPVANTSLVLNAEGSAPESGANVDVASSDSSQHQVWSFEQQSNGTYVIRNAANTDLVLDASGSTPASGANISAWTANGGTNQQWIMDAVSDGYLIRNAANPALVLDASGETPDDGANVSVWTSNGGSNQTWKFVEEDDLSQASVSSYGLTRNYVGTTVDLSDNVTVTLFGKQLTAGTDYQLLYAGSTAAPAGPGTYEVTIEGIGSYSGTAKVGTLEIVGCDLSATTNVRLVSRSDTSLVLDAAGNPPETGANVSVWSLNGGDNQCWNLELGTDGLYVIRSVADSTLVLDAAGTTPESGANISVWTENGGLNQRWVLSGSASEGYVITSAADSSLVLDAAGNPASSGSNVSAWTSNGGDNQKWNLATGYDLSLASVSSYGLTRNYLSTVVDLSNNVTVTMFGKELKAGTDYQLLYAGSTAAPAGPGTYEVTIEGIGSYSGTAKVGTLDIIGCDLSATTNVHLVSRSNSLLVLDAAGNPPETGANVSVWSANGGDNQSWNLELGTDGLYVIRSVADPTLVLDAAGTTPESGANISVWTENGGLNQRWVISGSASEGYVIKSAANPSLVLDAAGDPAASGSNVSVWISNGGDNQEWIL